MKKILLLMVVAVLMCACQRSRADQLESILKAATEQIKKAECVSDMQKIETETQNQIEKVMAESKDEEMKPEDAQKLGPALNDYYKAFYEKAAELGRGVPVPELSAEDSSEQAGQIENKPVSSTDSVR